MFNIGFQQADGVSRVDRVRRKCGIRHNPQQRGLSHLSHWTGCPACFCALLKPVLNLVVAFVRRPQQRNEHVHVKEINAHSCSASSSAILAAVTRGESCGRSKIVTPFTTRVGHGTVKPRRTGVRHCFAQRHRSLRRVSFHYRYNVIIERNCSTHGRMMLEQLFDVRNI